MQPSDLRCMPLVTAHVPSSTCRVQRNLSSTGSVIQAFLLTWLPPTDAIRLLQRGSTALNNRWCTGEQWLSWVGELTLFTSRALCISSYTKNRTLSGCTQQQ